MYLLYIDESGVATASVGSSTYFVLAGVAIHEEDCYPFARGIAHVQSSILGAVGAGLELHASRIWAGRAEWSHVSQSDRNRLLGRVFDHLETWTSASGRTPTFFAVAIHKPSFRGRSVLELAHEELLKRFDTFIGRLHVSGDSHRSLVIADDSSYEPLIQRLAPDWKRGARLGPLHSLIEVPLYVDSKASYLVQVADFVAWATFNYYERNHARYMQNLHARYDAADGIQHGLVHMIKRYGSCGCIPCESRRTHVVRPTLPASF